MKPNDDQHVHQAIDKKVFGQDLIYWYITAHRDLPWRQDRDPYKVWVSEVMLQQTRVDTVIPYFEHFIYRFPTIEALANADEEEVLKAWEGLGYYSRARQLQEGVREVAEKYDGKVPDNKEDISKLKSVGPYTAGAILSIAYGKAEPAVDGNVMRVLSRIFLIKDDITKAKTRKTFEQIVQSLIPENRASTFNQALMELGAMICTTKSPRCLLCPVQEHCRAQSEGIQESLPVKSRKKPPRIVPMAVAVLRDQEGRVLIHRRPNQGLLAGLWEFPGFEVSINDNHAEQLLQHLQQTYAVQAQLDSQLDNIHHVFTHLKWEMAVFEGCMLNHVESRDNLQIV